MTKRVTQGGATLIEQFVGLTIMGILLSVGIPMSNKWVYQYRVTAATNSLLGGIYNARGIALASGRSHICDANYDCERFEPTQTIILGPDRNRDGRIDRDDATRIIQLPTNTWVHWRRFRGNALTFHGSGISHYQNGHFLVCNKHYARKIIMNWAGRTRIEDSEDNPCLN